MKKFAKLIGIEKSDIEINTNTKIIFKNKTLIKKMENCKPFIGIAVLFLLASLILGGLIIYFLKFKNNSFNQV